MSHDNKSSKASRRVDIIKNISLVNYNVVIKKVVPVSVFSVIYQLNTVMLM